MMDEDMITYLKGMEDRLAAQVNDSQEHVLERMREQENHLMARMNDNQERVLERMRGQDSSIAVLTELARSANTLMAAIASSLTDIAGRVTRLESKT